MKCSKCQFENREGAKFCLECGGKLEIACRSCGKSLPPEAKFCDQCGEPSQARKDSPAVDYSQPQTYTPKHLANKILTTRASIEGERKLVTVMFADVANFTSMSEKLDPEEVHTIMDGCFKILMDEIHRYEGTINQFTGDGVMALFGAPVAHEDHAQRACRAALAIQQTLSGYGDRIAREKGVGFQMRIGINSGPVIVAAIGDDLRMDYTAVGDTTNLAARIQQSAQPGEVWISKNTEGIISGFFVVESVGSLDVKGKTEPQPVFRVNTEQTRIRTRFEAGLARGVTELVGRRPEMEILNTAWERAKAGEARVVDVVGEAGVGKSRLAYEFEKRIAGEATVLTGICIHYGRNINYLPVIDVVREAFGIEEGMSEEEAGNRIREKATGDLAPMIPFYRNLLSLKVDDSKFNALNPEGRKFGTFEAVKNALLSLSVDKPLLIFLEDVHWMDKISEAFFTFFSHTIQDHPIMMLAAYRPEGQPEWARGAHYRHIGIETLSMKSSIRLVMNILGGLELGPALEGKIAEKAGGNPFFIEEIVRELMQRGDLVRKENRWVCRHPINQLDIPSSIQGVIAARMDRLSEDLKRTMQVASVIGRDFAFRLLKSIMQLGEELRGHLTNLVGIEVLYEKALYPELEYIFKHALTQEVAYESMLKQRRREIHGRIGRAIEELYADKLEPHYELLAHHWELSDTPDRAIDYLVLAGEKSNKNLAAAAAADYFTRAINQLEKTGKTVDPELMLRIRIGRVKPLYVMGRIEECYSDCKEAIRLARELGDQNTLLELLAQSAEIIYNTTLKNEVPQLSEQGLDLARRLGNKGVEARILSGFAYWRHLWHLTDERETIEQALALAKSVPDLQAAFHAQLVLAVLERWRGNPIASLNYIEGMAETLLTNYNIVVASSLSWLRGWALTDIGRYQEALTHLIKWIEILEQNSIFLSLGRCYNSLGWVYSETYDLDKAMSFNELSAQNAVRLRKSPAMLFSASEMQAMAEVNIMENKFEMGKLENAWEHICRFEEIGRDPTYDINRRLWSTRMKDLKGVILLRRGDLAGAQRIVEQCLEVARPWEMKKYIGKAERLLGQVMTERSAFDRAESHFKTALQKLEEVGNPKQLWITRTALAQLYQKMGRTDLERGEWQAAKAVVEQAAAGLVDEELRSTFLNAAPIGNILERAGA